MKRSALELVPAVVAGVCVLVISVSAQRTAAQSSNACAGLSGAASGLCNAYCNALNCPQGHHGDACEQLQENWQRATGQPVFPCDPVCCVCPPAGPMCTTARQCRSTQCRPISRCKNGTCPCPCGSTCTDTAGNVGLCQPAAGGDSNNCTCQPPPPPCGLDPAGKSCGGVCPNRDDKCVIDATGANCFCEHRCRFDDSTNICGGACPPGRVCTETPNGCNCQPPQCGFDTVNNACGGPCPAGETCTATATGCACDPPPCGLTTSGSCGGACPNTSETCVRDPGTNDCTCKELPCGPNPFTGACGGPCDTPGETCQFVPGTANGCTCEPPPCGTQPGANTCGGTCPDGQSCVGTAASGCQCASPCGLIGANACGGFCTNPGDTCMFIAGATPPQCVCHP